MKVSSISHTEVEPDRLSARYPRAVQILHWLIAPLVAAQFALILVVHQLQSLELGQKVLMFHQQCGSVLLLLIVIRLVLAVRLRIPPSDFPRWQALTARFVHFAMIAVLGAQPILGLLISWSRGSSILFMGIVPIPAVVQLSTEQGIALEPWHRWLAYGLLILLAVHLGAVAFNRIVRKTSVTERILPARAIAEQTGALAFLRLCLGLCFMVSVVVGVSGYALQQYAAFGELSARFDDKEGTLLDDMRAAQLALVTAQRKADDKRSPATIAADVGAALDTIREFEIPGSGLAADSSGATASARRGAAKTAVDPAIETSLQDAIDSQTMHVFEGRLKITEAAAVGHDVILLALMPTIMMGIVLALLMARSLLPPASPTSRPGNPAPRDPQQGFAR
jgi:cytochrome b561